MAFIFRSNTLKRDGANQVATILILILKEFHGFSDRLVPVAGAKLS